MMQIDRREFSVGVAAAALLVISGCASLRRGSELDAAIAELDVLLGQIDGDDNEAMMAAASDISDEARQLMARQEEFAREYNSMATDRSTTDEMLRGLFDEYEAERLSLRNGLLESQDVLRGAVPSESWPDVLEVLNRKGQALIPGTSQEA